MITEHLGKKLPSEYLDFIASYKGQDFWLTMYPNTENQFSEEVFLWTKDQLLACTYDDKMPNYAYLSSADLDFEHLDFNPENGSITKEEVANSFVIGSLNAGFLFINLHDGSLWVWYSDMFCQKQADSFAQFQQLLTLEPIDEDFDDE